MIVLQSVLGVVLGALNVGYWWFVVRGGQERFRRACERYSGAAITLGDKGFWVAGGGGPWLRRFVIEWMQLVYFMGAFLVWAIVLLVAIVLMQWTSARPVSSPSRPHARFTASSREGGPFSRVTVPAPRIG